MSSSPSHCAQLTSLHDNNAELEPSPVFGQFQRGIFWRTFGWRADGLRINTSGDASTGY